MDAALINGDDEQPSLLQPPEVRSIGKILVSEQELFSRAEDMMDREPRTDAESD